MTTSRHKYPLWASLVILTIVLTGVFFGLSYASSSIPNHAVRSNIVASEEYIRDEPQELLYISIFSRDKTDGQMIGMCGMEDSCGVFHKVLMNPEVGAPPTFVNYLRYYSPDSIAKPVVTPYGRYWHGNQTLLKPMLVFWDYHNIKIFNYLAIFSLLVLTLIFINARISWQVGILYLISLLAVGIVFVPDKIQFSACFYVCFLAIIAILLQPAEKLTDRYSILLFYSIGAFTCYFDFLTTPILTVGVPLALLLVYRTQPASVKSTTKIIAAWCGGYVILWGMKWILVSIFTDYNMIADAWDQIMLRTDGDGWSIRWGLGFYRPLVYLAILLFVCILLTALYCSVKMKEHRGLLLSLLLIALLPYVWFFTFRNHSFIHFHFVWRIIAVSVFNILLVWYLILKLNSFKRILPSWATTTIYDNNLNCNSLL